MQATSPIPFIFLLDISVGVRLGARLGVTNYMLMTGYTALLCFAWCARCRKELQTGSACRAERDLRRDVEEWP